MNDGPTTLRVWMAHGPVRHSDLASRLQISPAYLSQLRYGVRAPAPELAARIERVTGGAVKATYWPTAALVRATLASREQPRRKRGGRRRARAGAAPRAHAR